jgi:hypothetical protein
MISLVKVQSQTSRDSTITDSSQGQFDDAEIKGLVLDEDRQTPLPYTNIYVLNKHRGVVSNETGHFLLNIYGLEATDTLRFQYIGYKTRNIPISQFDSAAVVFLKEDIINLSEILIFGSSPDPVSIVKKVLENKDSNYHKTTAKKQAFIRKRDNTDITRFIIDYKKSDIPELDREMLKLIEDKIPKYSTSYTDFLGYLYFTKNPDDSVKFKVEPVRTVSLKEEEIAELKQIEEAFEQVIADTHEEEYWKIRSGVFGQKLDMDEENDTIVKDSVPENTRKLKYFNLRLQHDLRYSSLDDKDQWEFLHSTGKYNYTLAGGTRMNGEDVYIIDFTPKSRGMYVGRMFITINTFALIRADYEFAPGKTGRDIHLLGVGYTENQFSGSIYFEKKNDNYVLKYFSYKEGSVASIDRNIALMKKRKRWLFDKTLNELKVGFRMAVNNVSSLEYLVLDEEAISEQQFADFEQPERLDIIYVDQFDDQLWKGFSIIEPTRQMKEYKKQEVKFGD